jgi:hypothetical protein
MLHCSVKKSLDFTSEDLNSRDSCLQEWHFLLSHYSAEKVCIRLGLFMINYSNKKFVKENTLPNHTVICTNKNRLF